MPKIKPLPFHAPTYKTIGHRGAGILAPENTLNSFRLAKKLGLSWVEFDTQPCATGEWIIMHDDNLERTSNGEGLIARTTWENLQKLKAGKEFAPDSFSEPIPLLSEALEILAFLGLQPNIEIKLPSLQTPSLPVTSAQAENLKPDNLGLGTSSSTPLSALPEGSLENFLRVIEQFWPKSSSPPLISSFDANILLELRNRVPNIPLGYNIDNLQNNTLEIFQRGHFFSLHCDHALLSEEVLQELVREPFPLLLYTVNDPNLAKQYFQKGVWAIFSDTPNLIAQSLF